MYRLGFILIISFLVSNVANSQILIINNTNVVDVTSGKITRDVSVVIVNNRVTAIVRDATAYKGQIIDGKNKYLIPGLWDMHTHNWNSEIFFPYYWLMELQV